MQRGQVHLLFGIEGFQHGGHLRADPRAVHPHRNAQRIQHRGGGARFAAGQEILRPDFGIFVRLEKTAFQQKGMGAQDLPKEIDFRPLFHGTFLHLLPRATGNAGNMGNTVRLIRVLPHERHADGLRGFVGRRVGIFAVGVEGRIIGMGEGPVPNGCRRLPGIPLPLAVPADVIADFGQRFPVDVLQGQPAVPDHLPRLLQAHRPKAEAKRPVSGDIPLDPSPDPLRVEGIRIVPHNVRIGQHNIQRVKIIGIHFPQDQSFCFQAHGRFSFVLSGISIAPVFVSFIRI